jgi:RNA polymerase sigma-70 factor (ECF subfamily)
MGFRVATDPSVTDLPSPRQSPGVDGATTSPEVGMAAPVRGAPASSSAPTAAVPAVPDFAEVYDAHFTAVWHALRRLGVWERDLDDAAHDVFVVVHRRLGDFDASRPVRPWLLGIAAKVASEFRRRSQHRHEVVSEDTDAEKDRIAQTATPAYGVAADRVLDDKERRALLYRALEHLDLDRRTVVVMHDIEGHGMPEIAEALQTNINTLYARLRAARAALKVAVVHEQQAARGAS